MNAACDCLVLGAGPAGAAAAAVIARAGWRVVLVEKQREVRCGHGELLLPSALGLFARLDAGGLLPAMDGAASWCIRFLRATGRESSVVQFCDPETGANQHAWHVRHGELAAQLATVAQRHGAIIRRGTTAAEALQADGRVCGARVVHADGAAEEILAACVIDATGALPLLAGQLGLVQHAPAAPRAGVRGGNHSPRRDAGPEGKASLVFASTHEKSWFYFLPLRDELVSVGLVAAAEYLFPGNRPPETVFEEELCHCPAVLERLMHAQLQDDLAVRRPCGITSPAAGPGWLLVGDALGAMQPLPLAGLSLLLLSAEMAADAVDAALRQGETSARALGGWIEAYHARASQFTRLADALFSESFSLGQFLREFPGHQRTLVDLLLGRPTSGGPALFCDLDAWTKLVRGNREGAAAGS